MIKFLLRFHPDSDEINLGLTRLPLPIPLLGAMPDYFIIAPAKKRIVIAKHVSHEIMLKNRNKNPKPMAHKLKPESGFSIIEVVFSVFVIAVGLTAVLSVLAKSIMNSIDSRNAIIASHLAQEGIELARNVRDNNWVNNNKAFSGNFPNNDNNRLSCMIDYSSTNPMFCSGSNDFKIKINNNFYRQSVAGVGTETKYKRKIIIDYLQNNNNPYAGNEDDAPRAKVMAIVTWNGNAPTSSPTQATCNILGKCVYVENTLTAWNQ